MVVLLTTFGYKGLMSVYIYLVTKGLMSADIYRCIPSAVEAQISLSGR